MSKKIIFIGMSFFLTYVSFNNFQYLNNKEELIINFEAVFQGIYFGFCITGIFAFSGLVLPLYKILPNDYYENKYSKLINFLYKFLKVDWFGLFLTKTFYKPKSKRKTFFNGKKSGIEGFLNKTKESEFAHLFPMIIILVLSIYFYMFSQKQLAIYLSVVNIFLNIYPIILQRYHRERLSKIINN